MDSSYNASFGMMPQAPVVSSGGGDVILSSSKGGKGSRKWLVGGILAIIILVIIVAILVIVSNLNGKNNGHDAVSISEQYLNYVVNGDVNNNVEVGTNYSGERGYYFAKVFYYGDDIEWSGFLSTTNGLLDALQRKISDETQVFDGHKEMLAFFNVYRNLKQFGPSSLMEKIVMGELEITSESINNELNGLDTNFNGYIAQYVENEKAILTKVGEVSALLQDNGCAVNSLEELEACQLSEEARGIYDGKIDEVLTLQNDVVYVISVAVPYYIETVYGLHDNLSAGVVDE